MQIKTLFDPSKDIYRNIEKVITYNTSQDALLKAEITEYIVTESIEDQLEELLSKMQLAMDRGEENEIGVWVSGFYGSGKSSFTKYLGLALDQSVQIDGIRFLEYLQARMNNAQTRALLSTVASRYPAAVVLLDLASEMLAGATMEEVSTVLYYKVLQWAGYSRNLKVAAFERRLKKENRYKDFEDRILQELGVAWKEVQNDPLVIDSLIPEIAHDIFPELFKTTSAFNTETVDFVLFENERVKEMIDIVRETTGKENIVFIIDEVGQYVSARPNLILNLDGLAKNLKHIGEGKVWILATAQQTLTEDDPRATLNSPELYKLKDRFPIQIDLESSDIREICYLRLLGKSPDGVKRLNNLFEMHGQELRFNTKLEDAKYYDADFDKSTFTNLYPFLPAHFDILLHLLGALAKSTGGIGLRSAIKVIQDILIEGPDGQRPVADQSVGWLATTVTIYDALDKDIRGAAPSIYKAVNKALIRFPDSDIHKEVAKTVAVLQILGNMPITAHNIASLTHPMIDSSSRQQEIESAIADLISDGLVPFGEKDGNLCFFSEKINDIEMERAQIPLRSIETRRIQNEGLREVFTPLPSIRLHNTLSVQTGLKSSNGSNTASLAGDKETVQTVVELVNPEDYDDVRTRLTEESRQRSEQNTIFLLGRTVGEIDTLVSEIYRSREIAQRYRNDPDQEVKEYCNSQTDRAGELSNRLQQLLKSTLNQGSFIFRGQATAVDSFDNDLIVASKKHLNIIAEQVFDRYNEAPVRAETNIAEKFLRASNLKAIDSSIDPLSLVQVIGGTPRIQTDHKALVSIKDFIDRNGSVDGKRLSDHFTSAPFGWSPDTLRYLVAALLINGEIKLKISGREIKVNGQQAIEALRTNVAFRAVGISLRDGQIPPNQLALAAQRMTELTGESTIPLEQEISKLAAKHFPQLQYRYGPLASKLENLGLPGVDRIRDLNKDLVEILETDASDVPQRLGAEDSSLFNDLDWAAKITKALMEGLEKTIKDLREHWKEIKVLPDSGLPGELKDNVTEQLSLISNRLNQDNFYAFGSELRSALTSIRALLSNTVTEMMNDQTGRIKATHQDIVEMDLWPELNAAEQSQIFARLESLPIEVSLDLAGLKKLLGQEFTIQNEISDIRRKINELGEERKLSRKEEDKTQVIRDGGNKKNQFLLIPKELTTSNQVDALIQQLQTLKLELETYDNIAVVVELKE